MPTAGSVVVRTERPDHPQVLRLLSELDRYLASLYAPEENHILGLPELLAPGVDFLAAWRDGDAVGCAAVRRASDGEGAYGEVKRMFVAPHVRGGRIGEQLLLGLEDLLRCEGVPSARLETGRHQREALRLYERNGYRRRSAFAGYPDNGLSLFYEKALG